MVYFNFKHFFLLCFAFHYLGHRTTIAQKCTFDNNLFTTNGSYSLSQRSPIGSCLQSLIISAYSNKAIILIFSNINIDCGLNSNLIVLDSSQKVVYDYCQAKYTNRSVYFIMIKSYYAYLNSYGPVSYSFDLYFIQINSQNQSTTTKPITTTRFRPTTTQFKPTTTQFKPTTSVSTLSTTAMTTVSRFTTFLISTTSSSYNLVNTCGVPAIKPIEKRLKIVGGIESIPNSWPWQVLITDNTYRCGASLINNYWVLTAAHCLDMSLRRLTATFGDHDIEKKEGSEVTISALKAIKHPKYDEAGNKFEFDYDIGLIKLKEPISFNNKIMPICLPNGKTTQVGKTAITTGWGDTKTEQSSSRLRQTTVNINQLSICSSKLSDRQLCAGILGPNVHDSCQGDSGGPLVLKDSGVYYLAGIVSSGYDDCEGHGIYTNVNAFQNWILETIRNN